MLIQQRLLASILHKGVSASTINWSLIQQINLVRQSFLDFKISHSYRVSNVCADILANVGNCEQENEYVVYDHVPAFLRLALQNDPRGVVIPRNIPV